MESNAKELKTLPVTEFPVELIGTLIERYKYHKERADKFIKINSLGYEKGEKDHMTTIREVLAVFGIDPDN